MHHNIRETSRAMPLSMARARCDEKNSIILEHVVKCVIGSQHRDFGLWCGETAGWVLDLSKLKVSSTKKEINRFEVASRALDPVTPHSVVTYMWDNDYLLPEGYRLHDVKRDALLVSEKANAGLAVFSEFFSRRRIPFSSRDACCTGTHFL
jgi:hypothetical protein